MLLLGFFFLLHPGEYAFTDNPNVAPFRVCDAHLLIHDRRIHPYNSTEQDLLQVNFIALEFTTQKNGVREELVGLGKSGHPTYCPVHALITRIRHLHAYNAPLTSPLYNYYDTTWKHIDTATLTTHLRTSTTTLGD